MKVRQQRGITLWISLGLIAINLIVYASAAGYGFVSFDDSLYVTDNPSIASGLTWQSARWAFTNDRAGYWIPLTWLSHILDVEFHGFASGPPHVMNVLIHVLNTVLLFGLFRRMTHALWQSAFAAALFAVHPLHVESVAWVAERKDVLSTLLWILTVWAYTAYVRLPNWRRYVAIVVAFALALMAKPMVLTLPFLLLLLDVWPLQRIRIEADGWKLWRRLVLEKVPLLALTIAAGLVTVVFSFTQGNVLTDLSALPLSLRAANASASYAGYIVSMLWPVGLAPFYPYAPLPAWQVAGSAALLLTISVYVIWKLRTHPFLFVGWFWYVGTLVPVIGLVQAGTQSRADRFTYIPIVGLFVIAAWGIPVLMSRRRLHAAMLPIAAGLVICAVTIAARRQVQHWENRVTLWQHALEVTNDNHVAHNVIGMALADEGRLDEAISHYRNALRVQADYSQARNNLGIALSRRGRRDEAIAEFRHILKTSRAPAETHYNLGFTLALQGRLDEAISQYVEAVRLEPAFVAAQTKLGDALLLQGKLDEAVMQYRKALSIQTSYAEAHNNLGIALIRQNKLDEAAAEFAAAIRIRPGFAEAHNGLGAVLANLGRYHEALPHFTEALRLEPRLEGVRENIEKIIQLQGKS
jgi:protein O-mannosyl-transferase